MAINAGKNINDPKATVTIVNEINHPKYFIGRNPEKMKTIKHKIFDITSYIIAFHDVRIVASAASSRLPFASTSF